VLVDDAAAASASASTAGQHQGEDAAAAGGQVRVCGSGGQSQISHVYTATSSTLKIVVHRVVADDDDDGPAVSATRAGYNFLLKYEGRSVAAQLCCILQLLLARFMCRRLVDW